MTEATLEPATIEFTLAGVVSVGVAKSAGFAGFALTPFEVTLVLGAVSSTDPVLSSLILVGAVFGFAAAESKVFGLDSVKASAFVELTSCALFSCTVEDFSTSFTVSALTV